MESSSPPRVPIVRYMTVSDDLQVNSSNPRLLDVIGLLYGIHAQAHEPFPLIYPQLCVFLALTDCRDAGECWLECVNDNNGQRVFRSGRHRISFGDDPLQVIGVRFRFTDCRFPTPGMYAVQFWYNGAFVEQKYVRVR
jgi:hypothetical protein